MIKEKKERLRKDFENTATAYLGALLDDWNEHGCWVNNEIGGLFCLGDEVLHIDYDDIRYCVENDITREEYEEWFYYCMKAHEYDFGDMNLHAWHKGYPRVPQETFDRLDGMKRDLEEAIKTEQEKF